MAILVLIFIAVDSLLYREYAWVCIQLKLFAWSHQFANIVSICEVHCSPGDVSGLSSFVDILVPY